MTHGEKDQMIKSAITLVKTMLTTIPIVHLPGRPCARIVILEDVLDDLVCHAVDISLDMDDEKTRG